MPISLYDATVPTYRQTLGAVAGFMQKGRGFFLDQTIDPDTVVETRLTPDMLPLRFQIRSTIHFSLGAIEALKSGIFRPPNDKTAYDYRGLQTILADALETLSNLVPADVDLYENEDVVFEVGDRRPVFKGEGFLLSFSLPNTHFHATTAYDILRARGVPLEKRDYLGSLRLKA